MNILIVLIPVSVLLGGLGLAACIWTLRSGQYDDLEGDAARIVLEDLDDELPTPLASAPPDQSS